MTSRLAVPGRAARWVALTSLTLFLWIHGTPEALATFRSTATASPTVSAHQLGVPTLSCGGLGVLSVTLNWTAPADTTQPDVYGSGFLASGYELARGTTAGGPYNTVKLVSGTSSTESLTAGTWYYVVRTVKHSWRGAKSNERRVNAVLFLAATCS
jgi:hypothetical protein